MLQNHGLLTAGSTVDEAAYLFTLMERTCQVQLLVESAGLPKRHIGDQEAEFTARINADPVRLEMICKYGRQWANDWQEVLYTEFQPDFDFEIWKSKGELCRGE
jgi:hypothetical protein